MTSYRGLDAANQAAAAPDYSESCALVFDQILTAKQAVPGASIYVDSQGSFLLRGMAGTQTGAYTLRIRLPDGRSYPNVQAQSVNLIGTGVFPTMLPIPVLYSPGSQIQIDITDVSNAANTVQIVLIGERVFPTR